MKRNQTQNQRLNLNSFAGTASAVIALSLGSQSAQSIELDLTEPHGFTLGMDEPSVTALNLPLFGATKPATSAVSELEQEFRALADEWSDETGMHSSLSRRAMHRAYQQIIGMGKEALPLILAELRDRPDHWFWALWAISKDDPAPEGNDYYATREAWLKWGRERGLLH